MNREALSPAARALLFLLSVPLPLSLLFYLFSLPVPHDDSRLLGFALYAFLGALSACAVYFQVRHWLDRGNPRFSDLKDAARANLLLFTGLLFLAAVTSGIWLRMLCIGFEQKNRTALKRVRAKIQAHARKYGRPPRSIEYLGALPKLSVWANDRSRGRLHRHRASRQAQIVDTRKLAVTFYEKGNYGVPIYQDGRQTGGRIEAAQTVSLMGDFNAFDPSRDPMRRFGGLYDGGWTLTKELDPGEYAFGFVLDGEDRSQGRRKIKVAFPNPDSEFAHDVLPRELRDTGGWAYDPDAGLIFIACWGRSESDGRPLYSR